MSHGMILQAEKIHLKHGTLKTERSGYRTADLRKDKDRETKRRRMTDSFLI